MDNINEHTRVLGERFPGLQGIGPVLLDSRAVRWAVDSRSRERAVMTLLRCGVSSVKGLASMSARDLYDLPHVGQGRVDEILDLAWALDESAAAIRLAVRSAEAFDPDGALDPDEVFEEEVFDEEEFQQRQARESRLRVVIEWAESIHGAVTVADVLKAVLEEDLPPDLRPIVDDLGAEVCPRLGKPALALEELGYVVGERALEIVRSRVLTDTPLTLEDLGRSLGITRERVRQLQVKAVDDLTRGYHEAIELRAWRWEGHRLSRAIGAAAPTDFVRSLVGHSEEVLRWILQCEGYVWGEDLVSHSTFRLPLLTEITFLDDLDVIVDVAELAQTLQEQGVLEQHLDAVMTAIPGLDWIEESLVRPGRSVVDRGVAMLALKGHPLDVEGMFEVVCPDGSARSFRNRMFEDPRVMRTAKNEVALSTWGLSPYGGVVDAMRRMLELEGEMALDDLADEISVKHDVSANSVRMYAGAPAFVVEGGYVSIRRIDNPFIPRAAPERVKGLFLDLDGNLLWNLAVDRDLLRGSGRSVPQEIGTFLGVHPGDRIVLTIGQGEISFGWLATSHLGPSIGSLRPHVREFGLVEGEQVQLTFKATEKGLAIEVLPASELVSTMDWLSRTTGVPEGAMSLENLARAAFSSPGELREGLMRRGDDEVVAALDELGLSGE